MAFAMREFLLCVAVICGSIYYFLSSILLAAAVGVLLWLAVIGAIVARVRRPWHHAVHTAEIASSRLPDILGNAAALYGDKINDPKVDYGLHHENIDIIVPANKENGEPAHTLRGWHIPPADAKKPEAKILVLCLHGAGRDRRAFLRHSPCLHAAGFGIALIDMREHGLSDRDYRGITYGPREAADVVTMATHAKAVMGYSRVVTVGTSTGASASLIAAAATRKRPDQLIDALVCECPFDSCKRLLQENIGVRLGRVPRFLLPIKNLTTKAAMAACLYVLPRSKNSELNRSPLEAAPLIAPRPVFFMHGGRDVLVSADHSRCLFAAAQEPKQIWISPSAAHTAVFDSAKEEWERRVITFIRTAFKDILPESN